jgi:GT2 family glycosyltransferase
VVIPAPRARETLPLCLAGLESQTFDDFETIVVEPRTRLRPGPARNLGAERARGETIVFLDADCRPDPRWLESLLDARVAGPGMVGGAIAGAFLDRRGRAREPGGWFARGVHMCKFASWVAGGPAGARDQLPTANLCVDRSTWETLGPFIDDWCEDTDLSWRARDRGIALHFEPPALVTHFHRTGPVGFWRERVQRGRAFAALRSRARGWSRPSLAVRVLAFPLVAPIMTFRTLRDARRAGRLAEALWISPVIFAGHAGWSYGEACVYARMIARAAGARSEVVR